MSAEAVSLKCRLYGAAEHTPCSGTTDDGTERNCECHCHEGITLARPVGSITEAQANGIRALCAVLARPVPALLWLSHREAGDLIMALRAETRGER